MGGNDGVRISGRGGHEIPGLEDIKWRAGFFHLQEHTMDLLGNHALNFQFPPLVSALLVEMNTHEGHEPDEPGMNNMSGYIPLADSLLLGMGKPYA